MTASMSWELDREHEEFKASIRVFEDLAGLHAVQPAVAAEAAPMA